MIARGVARLPFLLGAGLVFAELHGVTLGAEPPPLTATTEDGRRVILHSGGRWEFAKPGEASASVPNAPVTGKAQAAPPTAAAASSDEIDAAVERDRECQGGFFGIGRRVCPGDPDYNRGSLNPKQRAGIF